MWPINAYPHHRSSQRSPERVHAFTLIELLIVVAIIAILAAIAVPNFLEAQTRSKVSRSLADMKSTVTALESYKVDWNKNVRTKIPSGKWWGYTPVTLTTPVAYMTSLASIVFFDTNKGDDNWTNLTGQPENTAPYSYAQNSSIFDVVNSGNGLWVLGTFENGEWDQTKNAPLRYWISTNSYHPVDHKGLGTSIRNSAYFLFTTGPDQVDGTTWWAPAQYDPTNGSISFGDIYMFGSGTRYNTTNTSIGPPSGL